MGETTRRIKYILKTRVWVEMEPNSDFAFVSI